MADSKGRFPGPYVNDVKAEDPIMKRVDQDRLEIGARASGMPKDSKSAGMGLAHVGDTAGGKGK
jgi:hypothetical protein